MEHPIALHDQNLADPKSADGLLAGFAAWLRLNVAEGDAKPNTVRTYRAQAKQYLRWCRELGVDPARATEDDVKGYRRYLLDAGYKRATVALKLAVVRRLYEAAQWRGLRPDSPAAGIRAPREPTAREERVKFLPLDGLKRLLVAPAGDGPQDRRDRAMLALMGVHGLRVAEVAGLEMDHLDLDGGRLEVTGKGDKMRTVYLEALATAALSDWLAVRGGIAGDGVSALFVVVGPRGTGQPLSDRAIRHLVDGYLEALGLKAAGISCHALRHSAATWARAGGAQLDAIAAMLGHTSTDTTRIYARIVDKMAENPARFLEAMLSG